MKVFHLKTFATIISTLTNNNVHASSMKRTLRGGMMHGQQGGRGFGQGGKQGHHGGGRGPPPFMQAMVKDKCLNFDCDAVTDTTNIDCTIPMPDSPEIASMTKSMQDGETEEPNQRLLYCACCHSAIPGDEGDFYGFGNGGQGGHPFMQMMIEEECDTLKCDDIATDDLNCNIERPDRPNFATMTEEEKEDAWMEMQTVREEHLQLVISCTCCANVTIEEFFPEDDEGMTFGWPGHHQGEQVDRPFMQMMIEDECNGYECSAVKTDNLNCNIERPERPNFATMTEEEKKDAWMDMQVDREEHHQQILQCACCANVTIEELFPVDEGGDSFHAFGLRPGHGYHHNNHHDQSSGDEDVLGEEGGTSLFSFGSGGMMTTSSSHDGMMGAYDNDMTSSSSHDGFGMGHHGGHHGHQSNRPGMNKAEHILETQCPNHSCPNANNGGDSEAESSIMCPRLDEVMAMTKEERRQATLDCLCCRDDGMSELEDLNDEVEVSVLLSSLLPATASSAESGEQINAGACDVVTFVSGLAATALLFVIA